MNTVSNRFYIQCMEDGSSLHGQLLSDKSLTQAWSGTAAVPDWAGTPANRPLIWVDLLNGSAKVTPDSGGTWWYNGSKIKFSSTQTSTVIGTKTYYGYKSVDGTAADEGNFADMFFLTGKDSTSADPLNGSPAIGITDNLASSDNVDVDSITYQGAYSIGGAQVGFSCTATVKITGISSSGIFGIIEFIGSNIITEKNQTVYMVGRLFDASGAPIASGFTTQWYKDGVSIGNGTQITVGGVTYQNGKTVNEADVTDNTVIECAFSYVSGGATLTYSAFENIDDQTDPEQMYIQHNGAYDNAETLKQGGSVTWNVWVGTQTDSTVDTSWQTFYMKLLNAQGNVVKTSISGLPDVVSDPDSPYYDEWRQMSVDSTSHKAYVAITYDIVKQNFSGYMTAIVLAEKTQQS